MKDITMEFNRAEALILYDWLARFNDIQQVKLDEFEKQVLFNAESQLEALLSETVKANYKTAIKHARDQLRV